MVKYCAFILVIVLSSMALAKDYGVNGHTLEIKEEGFLKMLYRKLQLLDLGKENEKMQKLAIKRIKEPKPVEGMKKAEKDQSFTIDPSYMLAEDIILPNGQILYPAGKKINPLEHVSLDKKLVFIDGSSVDQVQWFIKQVEEESLREEDKLILVSGRPLDLSDELKRSVYFDQGGVLSSYFKIERLPAIVQQEGKLLRVKEKCISCQIN